MRSPSGLDHCRSSLSGAIRCDFVTGRVRKGAPTTTACCGGNATIHRLRRPFAAIVCVVMTLLCSVPARALDLQKFTDVRLIANPSNDGDSFVVQAGDRQLHLRIYFADCPESVATTDADAKRVREQARYFGITDAKKVFEFGHTATAFTANLLTQPFTIYTAFASALGRSPGGRVYAFVVTRDGHDLAHALVAGGLARADGSKRDGRAGKGVEANQKELQGLELEAMLERRGAWAAMDAKEIARLRAEQQAEIQADKELIKISAGKHAAAGSVDLNTASARDLQSVSGIGPVLATKIMEGRPYKNVDELLRISGIGAKQLDKIRPALVVNPLYAGQPLTIYMIAANGQAAMIGLSGDQPQAIVPAGCWFGATVASEYALVGCTVAPGFDFYDFEMGDRTALLMAYPQHRFIIERLTKSTGSG